MENQSREFFHKPTRESLWSETYYFDWVDELTQGFFRIGTYPNQGTVNVWIYLIYKNRIYGYRSTGLPKRKKHGLSVRTDGWELSFLLEEIGQRWRIFFQGTLRGYDSPQSVYEAHSDAGGFDPQFADPGPGSSFRTRDPEAVPPDSLDVTVDLTFRTVHDPFDYYFVSEEELEAVEKLIASHYDQAGRVQGTVRFNDRELPVEGVGERDHSWGLRDYSDPDNWTWSNVQFPGETAVNFFRMDHQAGSVLDGFLLRDGRTGRVVDLDLETDYREDEISPRQFTYEVRDDRDRRLRVNGISGMVVPVDYAFEDQVILYRRFPSHYTSPDLETDGFGWTEYGDTYTSD